jgi:hypothetical protein
VDVKIDKSTPIQITRTCLFRRAERRSWTNSTVLGKCELQRRSYHAAGGKKPVTSNVTSNRQVKSNTGYGIFGINRGAKIELGYVDEDGDEIVLYIVFLFIEVNNSLMLDI